MKSILLKDYLEQRMYFLIILAVAVVSLLVAAYFKQLDPGIAMVLLFGMQGPFFVYLAANHQISSEVNNRTFPFLISLPISRARLWLAKLIFVTIYALLLYAFYIVLSLICGESWNDFYRLFLQSPVVVLGIPLLIISYGYFTSMLPRGFATFSALIILPVGFAIGLNTLTISTLNYELGLVLLIPMFLVISALIFMRDRAMNSPWRGFKGIALLVAGIVMLLTCWTSINAAAERFWAIDEYSNSAWVPLNGGRQILWRVEGKTPWWDVLNPHRCDSSSRIILQDLETNEVKQIGSRMSTFHDYEGVANEGFVYIRSSRYTVGFLRGLDPTIFDHDGNSLIALPSPASENMKYSRLIDDKRFIYTEHVKNGQNVITEFSLYEKERGSKVVFSAQSDFKLSEFIVMPAKEPGKSANVYISGTSEREPGKILLVSAVDGSRHVLSVSPESDSVAVCSDYIVYEEGV
ncbi:MAG: ABC-2 transporter permease, partial [Candidatus Riflebacteria bacterium]|nr:ABC-2 transporter permease [Candidatus Riflebacteria bacterium]